MLFSHDFDHFFMKNTYTRPFFAQPNAADAFLVLFSLSKVAFTMSTHPFFIGCYNSRTRFIVSGGGRVFVADDTFWKTAHHI
jgi:hypothetical protein